MTISRRVTRTTRLLAVAFAVSLGACRGSTTRSAPAPFGSSASAFTPSARQLALADTVAERTFHWFWDLTDSRSGLSHDRWPQQDFSSVASIGFALTSNAIGAERGWISRAQSAQRTLVTLRYLWTLPQGPEATGTAGYEGFFYHFLRYDDGRRFEKVELSTIDTALLLAGALFAQSYYTAGDTTETSIRAYADSIYRRVNWNWAVTRPPRVVMGWNPQIGYFTTDWRGYNEAMILYILGLGSPTHPLPTGSWEGWSRTNPWTTYRGQEHTNFSPLFGHQYSHVWIDFRGIRDAYIGAHGIDWFENSRRATISQRQYAIMNPHRFAGYGANVWGLTASDGPADTTVVLHGRPTLLHSYWARGVSNDGDPDGSERDDGTIAPTAAISSMPFAPEIVFPAMVAMRERYGAVLFDRYGFKDAFNPSITNPAIRVRMGTVDPKLGWVGRDYLGIDQGPIVAMLENYRSQLIWKTMRTNPYIVRGLRRAGFTGGWLDSTSVGR